MDITNVTKKIVSNAGREMALLAQCVAFFVNNYIIITFRYQIIASLVRQRFKSSLDL